MPPRNSRKPPDLTNTTFHVYNRSADRGEIFLDDADRREFLACFGRYLSKSTTRDARGRPYRDLSRAIEVLSYCLMPNHFHLILHLLRAGAMEELMRGALTGYVKYFNNRHGRRGGLFSVEYKAAPKFEVFDIQTAIAYVHNNHPDGLDYKFSSHSAYIGAAEQPDWLNLEKGLAVFGNRERYARFMAEYTAIS